MEISKVLKHIHEPWRPVAIFQWFILTLFGVRRTYHEQKLFRQYRCPDCWEAGECKKCSCNINGLMSAPFGRCGTSEHGERKWGPMMSDKKWEKFKEEREIKISISSFYYESLGDSVKKDDLANQVEKVAENNRKIREEIDELSDKKNSAIVLLTERKMMLSNLKEHLKDLGVEIEEVDLEIEDDTKAIEAITGEKIKSDDMQVYNRPIYQDKLNYEKGKISPGLVIDINEPNGYVTPGKSYPFAFSYNGNLTIADTGKSCGCQSVERVGNRVTGTMKISKNPKSKGQRHQEAYLYLKPDKEYFMINSRGGYTKVHGNFQITVRIEYNIK